MRISSGRSRQLASLFSLLLLLLPLTMQFGKLPGLDRFYQRLELIAYDQRMQFHLPDDAGQDARIVIVDIDEYSLQQQGRWPWSRQRVAELVTRLAEAGAIIIGFDVLFGEPERNPVEEIRQRLAQDEQAPPLQQQLEQLAPRFDADATLAASLRQTEGVLGYTFNPATAIRSGQLPTPLTLRQPQAIPQLVLPEMPGYSAPLGILQGHSAGGGFFSLQPDQDGVVRRAPLLARHNDQLYGSLSLEMIRRLFFLEQVELETAPIGGKLHIEAIHLDDTLRIPTDGEGHMLIPFRGPAGSFPYISAHDVLSANIDNEQLTGSIVLIGTTAPGLFDLRATPVGEIYPGVEVHANLLSAILDNRYLLEPSWADGANFLIAVITGILLALLMPRLSPLWLILLGLVSLGALFWLVSWYWVSQGLVLALAGPVSIVILLGTFNLAWGFFFESLNRHRLKDMFGQYVPPELVDEMSEHASDFGFDGEAKELSVLFADIRSFTTISESLSADELKRFLNRYFTPMTRLIFEHRGTIDKYVGDMIMAFWGAPVSDQQHAIHAIETALEMLAETERLKPEFAERGWPEANIGIGINSGVMNVGDMGSEYRRAYTVLGDAVNLASRLEGTTKYYGVGLVIGTRTRELAGDHFVYRKLDKVQVKGKHEAITVYQPICKQQEASEALIDELESYHQAFNLYHLRHWDEADAIFAQLADEHPQTRLYPLYRERIAECRAQNLGEDWDGVFVRDSK
jgi:adenylate cyclase